MLISTRDNNINHIPTERANEIHHLVADILKLTDLSL